MRSGVYKHSELMPIKNWRRIGIPYRHDIGMILKRSRALSKGAMFSTGSGEQIVPEEAQHAETQRSSTSSFHWTHTAAGSEEHTSDLQHLPLPRCVCRAADWKGAICSRHRHEHWLRH